MQNTEYNGRRTALVSSCILEYPTIVIDMYPVYIKINIIVGHK